MMVSGVPLEMVPTPTVNTGMLAAFAVVRTVLKLTPEEFSPPSLTTTKAG